MVFHTSGTLRQHLVAAFVRHPCNHCCCPYIGPQNCVSMLCLQLLWHARLLCMLPCAVTCRVCSSSSACPRKKREHPLTAATTASDAACSLTCLPLEKILYCIKLTPSKTFLNEKTTGAAGAAGAAGAKLQVQHLACCWASSVKRNVS